MYWHLRGVDVPKRTIRINKLTTISGSYHPCIIFTYYISPCSRILVASHNVQTPCVHMALMSLFRSIFLSLTLCVCFTRYLCNTHGLTRIIPIILARKYIRVLFFWFAVIVVAYFKLGFCFQFFGKKPSFSHRARGTQARQAHTHSRL